MPSIQVVLLKVKYNIRINVLQQITMAEECFLVKINVL